MAICLGIIPIVFAVASGLSFGAGFVGFALSVLSFLVVWLYSCYKSMDLRYQIESTRREQTEFERGHDQLSYKVAAKLLELKSEELDNANGQVDDLTVAIDETKRELGKREAVIDSLQQRILNLNEEINGVPFGGRKITTSEHVRKLTGEDS
jgi:hypothetical protein